MTHFIDSHCHIDPSYYEVPLQQTIEAARNAGVNEMILIGATGELALNDRAVEISKEFKEIHCSVGIHPHDVEKLDLEGFQHICSLSSHEKVVAIGETGFDFYYDHSDKDLQKKWCYKFTELAIEKEKPVILHLRDAEKAFSDYVRDFKKDNLSGIVHCFTMGQKEADEALDAGLYISFSGILTFKNAKDLREVAKNTPLDRILIETDSPYLAPVPHRGKKNQPAFVVEIAKIIAELKEISLEEVKEQTYKNTKMVFAFN